MQEYVSYLFFVAIFGFSQALVSKPKIISDPEVIGVYVGQAAMLRCQVSNPQIDLMSWSSLTNNFRIFQGGEGFNKNAIKYSLINVAGGQIYNLQILNTDKTDQGFYKCAIDGTEQQVITRLNVFDDPSLISSTESPPNATGHVQDDDDSVNDDDRSLKITIGIGVTLSIISFFAITMLMILAIYKLRLQPSRKKSITGFDNPNMSSFPSHVEELYRSRKAAVKNNTNQQTGSTFPADQYNGKVIDSNFEKAKY